MPREKVLVLAGQSARNEEWLREMVLTLQSNPHFEPTPWTYTHWQTGEQNISVTQEADTFAASYGEASAISLVVAKSVGIVVLKTLLERSIISPAYICIMGVPVRWAETIGENLLEWLGSLEIPTLLLQNEYDPACNVSELRSALSSNNTVTLITLQGEGHEYNDMSNILVSIEEFLKIQRRESASDMRL